MNSLLEPLRDEPLPPSSVDLARAIGAGRRRVLARRAIAVATAGLTVIGIAVGIGAAVAPPTATRTAPISSVPPTTAGPPAAAPTAFDPMTRYAAFGWLPDGFTVLTAITTADGYVLMATPPGVPDGQHVVLRIVPAGHDISAISGSQDFSVPLGADTGGQLLEAPAVHGRTAWWSTSFAVGSQLGLRWEYAPGARAEVAVVAHFADPKQIARQVAEAIRYAVNEPVRLPYSLSPPGLVRPTRVILTTGNRPWEARVGYGTPDAHGDWPLDILMIPWTGTDGYGNVGLPNTTVDGHLARTSTGIYGEKGLQLYDVQGLYMEINCADPTLMPNGLEPIFRSMTFYPDPTTWR